LDSELDSKTSDDDLLRPLRTAALPERANPTGLCERYGREVELIVPPLVNDGVIADDGGYMNLGSALSPSSPTTPSGVVWNCEEGELHVQLSSLRRLDAESWPAAQANLLARLKSRGLDANRDKMSIVVGPDDVDVKLDAARAGNTALQGRLKQMKEHEAKTVASPGR